MREGRRQGEHFKAEGLRERVNSRAVEMVREREREIFFSSY